MERETPMNDTNKHTILNSPLKLKSILKLIAGKYCKDLLIDK